MGITSKEMYDMSRQDIDKDRDQLGAAKQDDKANQTDTAKAPNTHEIDASQKPKSGQNQLPGSVGAFPPDEE